MNKPPKLSKHQLVHPKAEKRSKFNGDVIKPKKDQGFAANRQSQGLTVVEGTRPQSNVREVIHGRHPGAHAPMTRDLKPTADPMVFEPVLRPAETFNLPELTERQARMMRGGNGRKR